MSGRYYRTGIMGNTMYLLLFITEYCAHPNPDETIVIRNHFSTTWMGPNFDGKV